MGCGVVAGASSGYHVDASKPRNPDSATVGTSASAGERLPPATASAAIFPALMCGSTLGMDGNHSETWPDSRSVVAWPITLYGTWVSAMPAMLLNNSIVRCPELPLPVEA